MKQLVFALFLFLGIIPCVAQIQVPEILKILDTGQDQSYTNTFGEDADFLLFPPTFSQFAEGIVFESSTQLYWQQQDGGEMSYEKAKLYADTMTLVGFTDWRLPTPLEAYSIMNLSKPNPAIFQDYFTSTEAEYWWTSSLQSNDTTKVWVTNAGGGIGNHSKMESKSEGGSKSFHVRAVRSEYTPKRYLKRFNQVAENTFLDSFYMVFWYFPATNSEISWEKALMDASNLPPSSMGSWRLPNVKELHALGSIHNISPACDDILPVTIEKYWTSTSLSNRPEKAWIWDSRFGITTYDDKSLVHPWIAISGPVTVPVSNPLLGIPNYTFFPNPCSSKISIFPTETSNFQLIDWMGRIQMSGIQTGSIETSGLPSGIYLLCLGQPVNHTFQLVKSD